MLDASTYVGLIAAIAATHPREVVHRRCGHARGELRETLATIRTAPAPRRSFLGLRCRARIFAVFGMLYAALAPFSALVLGRMTHYLDVFGVVAVIGVLLTVISSMVVEMDRCARARGDLPPAPAHADVVPHAHTRALSCGLFTHVDIHLSRVSGLRRTRSTVAASGPSAEDAIVATARASR